MHVLILGAAGMLGRKLAKAVASAGFLDRRPVTRLTLADVIKPEAPIEVTSEGPTHTATVAVDLATQGAAEALVAYRPDVIFHLAAIVSSEAEADFEKGYLVNLDGTRALFEAIRGEAAREPYRPRLVFTSSIAIFGPPFPNVIQDDFIRTPQTSYGTQKAICELLLDDYSRRGIFDGVALRLPTICIRPGRPNRAASGFFSSILREPLVGQEAVLPVSEDVRHWHASPRAAVAFLLHAASLATERLGTRRALTMPGVCASVGEQIEALRRVAGDRAVALIQRVPDPAIAKIISGWPQAFSPQRALALGFCAEKDFDEIIRVHIEDELGGRLG